MAMSRRDFEEIAGAVAQVKERTPDSAHGALAEVTRALAGACARRYTGGYGFNRSLFLQAFGFPDADHT